jgi:hypothetical protein
VVTGGLGACCGFDLTLLPMSGSRTIGRASVPTDSWRSEIRSAA